MSIEARRPCRDGSLAGRDRKNAAADAAFSRQPNPKREFAEPS
jgi:hypothetical protein